MSYNSISNASPTIRTEACAWIAQLETGDMTREDIESFREWLQRSPQHVAEIRKLANLSADLNVMTEMAGPLKEAAKHYDAVVRSKAGLRWRLRPWLAAFLVVIAISAAFIFLHMRGTKAPPQWPIALSTAVGEYREAGLPDGSTINLNTDSRLEVEFDDSRRSVRLLQGEALFTVAHEPDRPFVVYAEGRLIQAIGTAFLVRIDPESLEVAVAEGKVSLREMASLTSSPASGASSSDMMSGGPDSSGLENNPAYSRSNAATAEHSAADQVVLHAGQSWKLLDDSATDPSPSPKVDTLSTRDLQRKLAWREGLLDFSDTPLEEVVREVSRYTTLTIEIEDPTLRDMKFGGLFRTGDPQPLFTALEDNYDIQVEYIDSSAVRLTQSDSSEELFTRE